MSQGRAPSAGQPGTLAPSVSSDLAARHSPVAAFRAAMRAPTVVESMTAPRRTPVEESRRAVTKPGSDRVQHMTLDELVRQEEDTNKKKRIEESLRQSSPASRISAPAMRSGAQLAAAALGSKKK